MVASLSVRVYNGSAAANESNSVTGIAFLSADLSASDATTRNANPITVGTRSYEKWIKLKIDTKPTNSVSNFKIWGDGATQTSTTLYFTGNYQTGTTPTNASSTIANVVFTNFSSSGSAATWDTTVYTNTNATTRYAVFQLSVGSDCNPGDWTQETINYSYDEQ